MLCRHNIIVAVITWLLLFDSGISFRFRNFLLLLLLLLPFVGRDLAMSSKLAWADKLEAYHFKALTRALDRPWLWTHTHTNHPSLTRQTRFSLVLCSSLFRSANLLTYSLSSKRPRHNKRHKRHKRHQRSHQGIRKCKCSSRSHCRPKLECGGFCVVSKLGWADELEAYHFKALTRALDRPWLWTHTHTQTIQVYFIRPVTLLSSAILC